MGDMVLKQYKIFKIIFLCIASVVSSYSFSQKSNKEVNQSTLMELEFHKPIDEKELLQFIKEDNSSLFQGKEEYINFIIEKAKPLKGSESIEYAELCFWIANQLTKVNQFYKAYEYLDVVSTILKSKDISKISFAANFYELKGTYFYKFRRYEEARLLLLKALKQNAEDNSLRVSVINTLGLVQRKLSNIDSSIYYFNMALSLAKELNNNEWIGVINGNLGHIYYIKDDYNKAKKYLVLDQELSLKNGQIESALNAVAFLIEIDIANKNYDLIKTNMKIMDSLIGKVDDLSLIMRYHYT